MESGVLRKIFDGFRQFTRRGMRSKERRFRLLLVPESLSNVRSGILRASVGWPRPCWRPRFSLRSSSLSLVGQVFTHFSHGAIKDAVKIESIQPAHCRNSTRLSFFFDQLLRLHVIFFFVLV